ncbi:MAG: AraC family transcriptional regulator [Spirochaetota bacterium]
MKELLENAFKNERLFDIIQRDRTFSLGDIGVRIAVFHQVRMNPGAVNPVHTHACHELSFVREGVIEYSTARAQAQCGVNDCFFLTPFIKHNWRTPKGAVVDGFMLDLTMQTGQALTDIASQAAARGHVLRVPVSVPKLFTAIDAELKNGDVFMGERVSIMIRDLLFLLFRANFSDAFRTPARSGLPAAKTREEQLFSMARTFIDDRRREHITLRDVAAHLNVTPRYVNRIFNKFIDVACGRYIQEQKLWDAFTMLKMRPAMKIKEVAHACGWRDYMYFTRAFTKKFLSTPKKVRASVFN